MAGFDTKGFNIGTVSPYITGTDGSNDGGSAWEYLDDGTDFWAFGVDDEGFFRVDWWLTAFTKWLMIGAY